MTVLVKKPNMPAEVAEMDNTLEALQQVVGGTIECVYPFKAPIAIIVNDGGKLLGMDANFVLAAEGEPYDLVVGTAIIAGLSEDDFQSLDADSIESFSRFLNKPQIYCLINNKIIPAIAVDEDV